MRTRLAAVLGLLILAPIGAEYLIGYDTSTGNWRELLGNLVIFVPLYGAAALLIRELSVRAEVGWRGRMCWAAAFGVVQAGLVDHSLFNPSYRDISYWQEMVGPTWIPALGLAAGPALLFVVGHLVFSICVPVAMVESIHPTVRDRAWLGPVGLVLTTLAYLAASAFVVRWSVRTEDFLPGVSQLIGAGVVVVGLVIAGLVLGRRAQPPVGGRTPSRWLLGAVTLVAVFAFDFSTSWIGTLVAAATFAAALVALSRLSRTAGWSARHLLLVAGGAMLARALEGFLVDPIGDGSDVAKYVHNTVAVLLVLVLVAIGWIRNPDPLNSQRSRARHAVEQASDGDERNEIRELRRSR